MKKRQVFSAFNIILFLCLSSCSWLQTTTRGTLEDNGSRNRRLKKDNPKGVSQEQFDSLLNKYKSVVAENQRLKEKYEYGQTSSWKNRASAASANTVQIDAKDFQNSKQQVTPIVKKGSKPIIQSDQKLTASEFRAYGKARELFDQRKYSESLKLFQNLENSKNDQIRVRAKYYSGLILFNQKEFDISLQVFEEILEKMAFSSFSLEALQLAYESSVKLNMEQKSLQYKSLLQDVFKKSVR